MEKEKKRSATAHRQILQEHDVAKTPPMCMFSPKMVLNNTEYRVTGVSDENMIMLTFLDHTTKRYIG